MQKTKKVVLLLITLTSVILFLTNTRAGMFLLFDGLDSFSDSLIVDASRGPLKVSRTLIADSTYALPDNVEQPSGIVFYENAVYVSTDQSELFTFDSAFSSIEPRAELLTGILLFKQGLVEALTIIDGRVLAVGDFGAIGVWAKESDVWVRQEDSPLPASVVDKELSGVCVNSAGMWATTGEEIGLYNLDDGSNYPIKFGSFIKPEGDISQLLISGVACDEDNFYLITENYTSIVVLDDMQNVIEVIGIDAGEASDIAIQSSSAYVTVDHNYFDPRPPVYRYMLAE